LLPGAIIVGEAAHHAKREEEFHRLGPESPARCMVLLKSMPSNSASAGKYFNSGRIRRRGSFP
jgi:hypothetical protein